MKAKTIKQVLRKKLDAWLESITDEAVRELAAKNSIITGGAIASMLLREQVSDYDVYFRDKATTLAVAKYYVARFIPCNTSGIKCAIYVHEGDEGHVRVVVQSAGIASEGGTSVPYEYFEGSPDERAAGYVSEIIPDAGDVEDRYEETEKKALEVEDDDKPKFRPVFMSTNAITLSHRVQLVLRFYGEPDEIHKNYDFVHCTNYWTSWDNKLVLRPEALESLLTKELRYVGSKYPVCSVIRLRKFIARQWTINAGQVLKMLMQINELDLTQMEVLQDQLTGVDAAYFCEIIQKLKDKDPEKINTAYLVEIIDRMF